MDTLSSNESLFEIARLRYRPPVLGLLDTIKNLQIVTEDFTPAETTPSYEELSKRLPYLSQTPRVKIVPTSQSVSGPILRIGALLSGGQAPGGHNVIIGLFEALKVFNPENKLFGFLKGPLGLVSKLYKELTPSIIYNYYNTGGFDMLSSSREKIETEAQKEAILKTVTEMNLDGLLIIGGDNSNTDNAILANYFSEKNIKTTVIGVPKTVDGDLKNQWIETSLGFDTACKTYSEIIGNLAKDVLSAKKYYHFIRLMGRSASYTTLECALKTNPNIALISEEIAFKGLTLKDIGKNVLKVIQKRQELNRNYGIILIPEGLIEQIKDTRLLIREINNLIPLVEDHTEKIPELLSIQSATSFKELPESIQKQLLLKRDSHGNVRVSEIKMEDLIVKIVNEESAKIKNLEPFNPITHFLGYESRAGFPSNFDSNYGMALGIVSALLLVHRLNGYMAVINNLNLCYRRWTPGAVPLFNMMHIAQRKGRQTPVIKTDLVNIENPAFKKLETERKLSAYGDNYIFPGPIQFFGPSELCDTKPLTLTLEQETQ
ncbi:MAG: diphosphate--fructose-6-phosphate 1-phosphotransferase [Victivallaceae bacterium]